MFLKKKDIAGNAGLIYFYPVKGSPVEVRGPNFRGVAQPGSAPRSGRGGRRFESCRPDNMHIILCKSPQMI